VSRDPVRHPGLGRRRTFHPPWRIHEIASDSGPAADGREGPTYSGNPPAGCRGGHPCRLCRWPVHHKANGGRTQHHGRPQHPADHPRRHQAMAGTHPNGAAPPGVGARAGVNHGNTKLRTATWPGGCQGRSRLRGQRWLDPYVVRVVTRVIGRLSIPGRRLDASAPPLGLRFSDGYGDRGFQASGVIFPPGMLGDHRAGGAARLTLVNVVIKV
jgi:hypothetical protein